MTAKYPSLLSPLKREVQFRIERPPIGSPETENLSRQWDEILANSDKKDLLPAADPKQRILFVTGYGLSPTMLSVESVLAAALHVRGAKIASLHCNAFLPCCEFNPTGNNRPNGGRFRPGLTDAAVLNLCATCETNYQRVYSKLPLEVLSYKDFLGADAMQQAQEIVKDVTFEKFRGFEYGGVKVGEEVFASVLRATLRGTVEDSPTNRWYVKRYLLGCTLMAMAAEAAYTAWKPDRIVGTHGVYATHGIAVKVAGKMGIPFIVYGIPYRKQTLWLSHKETYHRTLISEPQSYWKNNTLSPAQSDQIWEYLLSRQAGNRDHVTYHPNPIEDAAVIYKELKIDKSRPLISLFTNVIWDAQLYHNFNIFDNIFEWLFTTIEELGKNDNIWLAVRMHPAEVKGGNPTQQPFMPEILKRFPVLPANVRLIPPESDLSSYTLAECSRVAVVYGTKMSLEIAARGIPVVVSGETFMRGKGFTIDMATKEQYLEVLRNIHTMAPPAAAVREEALKYGHYLFFRKMIDFPFVEIAHVHASKGIRLTFRHLDALKPGANTGLDTICEGIMDLKPLHMASPTPTPENGG